MTTARTRVQSTTKARLRSTKPLLADTRRSQRSSFHMALIRTLPLAPVGPLWGVPPSFFKIIVWSLVSCIRSPATLHSCRDSGAALRRARRSRRHGPDSLGRPCVCDSHQRPRHHCTRSRGAVRAPALTAAMSPALSRSLLPLLVSCSIYLNDCRELRCVCSLSRECSDVDDILPL